MSKTTQNTNYITIGIEIDGQVEQFMQVSKHAFSGNFDMKCVAQLVARILYGNNARARTEYYECDTTMHQFRGYINYPIYRNNKQSREGIYLTITRYEQNTIPQKKITIPELMKMVNFKITPCKISIQ